jgi:hypothetical protein
MSASLDVLEDDSSAVLQAARLDRFVVSADSALSGPRRSRASGQQSEADHRAEHPGCRASDEKLGVYEVE